MSVRTLRTFRIDRNHVLLALGGCVMAMAAEGALAQAFPATAVGAGEVFASGACEVEPPVSWSELATRAVTAGLSHAERRCRGEVQWLDDEWTETPSCARVASTPADPIVRYAVDATRSVLCIPNGR